MTQAGQHEASQLFTLRVWHERLGNGRVEWRGQIRHVLTGQVHYFRGWSALLEQLQTLLQSKDIGDEPEPADESAEVHGPRLDGET